LENHPGTYIPGQIMTVRGWIYIFNPTISFKSKMSDYFENKHKQPSESDRGTIPYEDTLELKNIKTVNNTGGDPDRGIGVVDNAVRTTVPITTDLPTGGEDSKKL
jgi:hypothetical protein